MKTMESYQEKKARALQQTLQEIMEEICEERETIRQDKMEECNGDEWEARSKANNIMRKEAFEELSKIFKNDGSLLAAAYHILALYYV